jgi:hypothetical protein
LEVRSISGKHNRSSFKFINCDRRNFLLSQEVWSRRINSIDHPIRVSPWEWVFKIGIYAASLIIFKILKLGLNDPKNIKAVTAHEISISKIGKSRNSFLTNPGLMGIFLIIGLTIPWMNTFRGVLPAETNLESNQTVETRLLDGGILSNQEWQAFQNDPKHLIVQGRAFHPRYYISSFYWSDDPSFEMMVLGDKHVFISYALDVEPDRIFSDGSDVILVGCQIGKDSLWGADRIIMRSLVIIQLDHERSFYLDPNAAWICP